MAQASGNSSHHDVTGKSSKFQILLRSRPKSHSLSRVTVTLLPLSLSLSVSLSLSLSVCCRTVCPPAFLNLNKVRWFVCITNFKYSRLCESAHEPNKTLKILLAIHDSEMAIEWIFCVVSLKVK